MPTPNQTAKRGRPATGNTRKKVSISIPTNLANAAAKQAVKTDESLSAFIARAIQTQLLNS